MLENIFAKVSTKLMSNSIVHKYISRSKILLARTRFPKRYEAFSSVSIQVNKMSN